MVLNSNVIEGILVSRESPFSRNKGFTERFDKIFQETGFTSNSAAGSSILYDVRSLYGFFIWLQNPSTNTEVIDFQLFESYKNFDKVTDLTDTPETDWVEVLDSLDAPISGSIAIGGIIEVLEEVRITSKTTAIRLDIHGQSLSELLTGIVSAV